MALEEKYALITGSSRGIGRGIALALAESGVRVGVHYFQNEAAAKETLEQIRKRGSDGFVVQADVTRPEQIAEMFRRLKAEFGHLDIFITNARPEAVQLFSAASRYHVRTMGRSVRFAGQSISRRCSRSPSRDA